MVSISACHAEDPGSIPGGGVLFSFASIPSKLTLRRKLACDSVSERLRRWTRNPLGSARRGSNPLAVESSFCWWRFFVAFCSGFLSSLRLFRLAVRTSRCGRDNPGSNPGRDNNSWLGFFVICVRVFACATLFVWVYSSAVERLTADQQVPGSNPGAPC